MCNLFSILGSVISQVVCFVDYHVNMIGLILIIYVLTQMDARMDGTVLLPSWVFYTFSACIQWFDMFDNADGVRARRLKCGSPVGRIVDEALDLIN